MFGLGMPEMIALLVIGVILFGRKLPDVGRSLGKTIVGFKEAMNGMEDEIKSPSTVARAEPEAVRPPQRVTASAPVFSDTPVGAASNLPPKV